MNRNILNFAVRDRAGDTLIETDFPRLAAQRVARRAQIRRPTAEYFARRDRVAAIVASLDRPVPRRPMAVYLPAAPMATRPMRGNATLGAVLVSAALIVAALVLWVAA